MLARKSGEYKNRVELLQGTLDMLILNTLSCGPQQGYGISQAIRAGSSDVLVETGSLYSALRRRERNGWLKFAWKQAKMSRWACCPLGHLVLT